MKIRVDVRGMGDLSARLERLGKEFPARLEPVCAALAQDITATAKGMVYQNGLTHQDGAIRDSLHGFAKRDGDTISFGVKTGLDIAIYHEMGTGPVGTAAGYPGEGGLDQPVARRSTGWVYWSDDLPDEEVEKRTGLTLGKNRSLDSIQDALTFTEAKSGFVYTEGVPPKAFMHNAVMQNKEDAVRELALAVKEVLSG